MAEERVADSGEMVCPFPSVRVHLGDLTLCPVHSLSLIAENIYPSIHYTGSRYSSSTLMDLSTLPYDWCTNVRQVTRNSVVD